MPNIGTNCSNLHGQVVAWLLNSVQQAGFRTLAHGQLGDFCMNKISTEVCGAQRPLKKKLIQLLGVPFALALAIVVSGCAGNQYERSTGESVDDTATTGRVKRALSADKTYKYSDVKVTTFKGNVQLSGFVDNNEQKDRATELAKTVSGVKDVENRITIK